jgi:hypothetical protein
MKQMSQERRTNQRYHKSPQQDSSFHDLYLRTQIEKEISEKKEDFHNCQLDTNESARREGASNDHFEPASVLDRPEPTLKTDNSTKFIDSLLFDITKSSSKIKTLNILQHELNGLYEKQENLDAKEGRKTKAEDNILNDIAAALKRQFQKRQGDKPLISITDNTKVV